MDYWRAGAAQSWRSAKTFRGCLVPLYMKLLCCKLSFFSSVWWNVLLLLFSFCVSCVSLWLLSINPVSGLSGLRRPNKLPCLCLLSPQMNLSCYNSSDPVAANADLLYDFNDDEENFWERNRTVTTLPSCSSSLPPDSPCQVCLSDRTVYAMCRNLADGVKMMMEAGKHQVRISKSGKKRHFYKSTGLWTRRRNWFLLLFWYLYFFWDLGKNIFTPSSL